MQSCLLGRGRTARVRRRLRLHDRRGISLRPRPWVRNRRAGENAGGGHARRRRGTIPRLPKYPAIPRRACEIPGESRCKASPDRHRPSSTRRDNARMTGFPLRSERVRFWSGVTRSVKFGARVPGSQDRGHFLPRMRAVARSEQLHPPASLTAINSTPLNICSRRQRRITYFYGTQIRGMF